MSIASDEAAKIYPLHGHSSEAYEKCMVSRADYVKGRTAPATEGEIEAAAKQFYWAFTKEFSLTIKLAFDEELVDWDDLTEEGRKTYRSYAKRMLSAARKQVSDE